MSPSIRWRPQVGSGDGFGSGAPPCGVTIRTLAPPAVEHSALYAFAIPTQGVGAAGQVTPSSEMPTAIEPGANGVVGTSGVSRPDPPCSDAGFVHRTC